MPVKYVRVRHDDGQWYEAELLDQHRSGGRWRAVVRYSVAPGSPTQASVPSFISARTAVAASGCS
jgi:hypothetical protein